MHRAYFQRNGLKSKFLKEWERRRDGEDQPSQSLLTRIAQRICSRQLYEAWRSAEMELRELAFEISALPGIFIMHSHYAQLLASICMLWMSTTQALADLIKLWFIALCRTC